MKLQQKDKSLLETAKKNNQFKIKKIEGVEKIYSLICFNNKIVVPKDLQKRMVQWYHTTLNYLGESRIELTISQHFYWKSLHKTVHNICSKCEICQRLKWTKSSFPML